MDVARRGSLGPTRAMRSAWAVALALVLASCTEHAEREAPSPVHLNTYLAAPEPVGAEARGGYWLSVDLLGPAAAQQAAATELGEGLPLRDPAETPPPGIMIGHVSEVTDALRWVARFAFEPRPTLPPHPAALQRVPAPEPAGGLQQRHGATLAAFVVSGATPDLRPRTIE